MYIGLGDLDGRGVYAERDFQKGEVVIPYHLRELSEDEYENLSEKERWFVHIHRGKKMLYGEPERYVNHSESPNMAQDFEVRCDRAICDIRKGEMITTDATKDDI